MPVGTFYGSYRLFILPLGRVPLMEQRVNLEQMSLVRAAGGGHRRSNQRIFDVSKCARHPWAVHWRPSPDSVDNDRHEFDVRLSILRIPTYVGLGGEGLV